VKNNFKNVLVVGLGNPGNKYKFTRHNVGFLFLDFLIDRFEINLFLKSESYILYIKNFISKDGKVRAYLMYPYTYMNNSGKALIDFLSEFKSINDIIVIHDDIDLPLGKIRIKRKSGHGGHNGVKSIIEYLGHNNFKRIKIGIGRPARKEDIPDYVLSKFSEGEFLIIKNSLKEVFYNFFQLLFEFPRIKKGGEKWV